MTSSLFSFVGFVLNFLGGVAHALVTAAFRTALVAFVLAVIVTFTVVSLIW